MADTASPTQRSPRSRSRTTRSPRLFSQSPSPTRASSASKEEAVKAPESPSTWFGRPKTYISPTSAALYTFLISLLAIPLIIVLDETSLVASPGVMGAVGVVTLVIVFYFAYEVLLSRVPRLSRDPYIAWFVLFAFTCVVDLLLAIEIDFKIGVMDWFAYLHDGERYLRDAWGGAANWWDATAHWVLYIIMVYALCLPRYEAFRPVFLFWVGDIVNSLFVLVPGGAVGVHSHNLTYSTLLNTPYILIPVIFGIKIFKMSRPRDGPAVSHSLVLELLFALFLAAFTVVSVLRFAVANDSKWDLSVTWVQEWEPILIDPSAFFKVQSHVFFFYLAPVACWLVYAIVVGGHHIVLRDFLYLFAGACAQAQFCILKCAASSLTDAKYRADGNSNFWLVNVALFAVPQLIAYYAWKNSGFKGLLSFFSF